jgi:hypothetical protein
MTQGCRALLFPELVFSAHPVNHRVGGLSHLERERNPVDALLRQR